MTTYAAINSLALLGAYDKVDRSGLYRYFLSMKQRNGSFSVHIHGFGMVPRDSVERRTVEARTAFSPSPSCCTC